MRDSDDIRQRWRVMQSYGHSRAELEKAVKYNGDSSPCLTGLRSVCWKAFLLSKNHSNWTWISTLRQGREQYTRLRNQLLKYIKHPEALAEITVDPLADDPNSPWDTIRQDEAIRAEIRQDVQRLPDEANYHEDWVQDMILDVLFIYCKENPNRGGYRQGMHELLAPFVHALETDAINRKTIQDDGDWDEQLLEIADLDFIEHDAYILFTRLMDHAQTLYAIGDQDAKLSALQGRGQSSTIVERSKFIHEVCLQKVDPELASHLTSMDVLPQIFLIRWVRLLFSREFPFEQFMELWDMILAVDPTLELVDLVCVAMVIRIRWQLLEGDYSGCLQLLLKYPPPEQPHGPNTFVDDAVYLRGHLNSSGGATLIMKYTGKLPTTVKSPDSSRSSTPGFRGFNALRQRTTGARSPSFMNQQVGVEAIFQGAAKGARGVFERGEKLGINQAVRDAMGEIRRNVSGFNESRQSPRLAGDVSTGEAPALTALAALEQRNRQLASMLDETVTSLKEVSASNLEDKNKSLELIEVAAAKVQFVKIYLEDPSMEVPAMETPAEQDQMQVDKDIDNPGSAAGQEESDLKISSLSLADDKQPEKETEKMEVEVEKPTNSTAPLMPTNPLSSDSRPAGRPAPIPTRSTLAQSSFSWMLEPNETSMPEPRTASKSPSASNHKKGPSNSASRERSAFLFGEVTSGSDSPDNLRSDDIFGMEPIRKNKSATPF